MGCHRGPGLAARSADHPKLRVEHDEDSHDHDSHDHDSHGELSLKQLSDAYAQVLQEQSESGETSESTIEPDDFVATKGDSAVGIETERLESEGDAHGIPIDELDANDNSGCAISPQTIVEAILFVGAPSGVKLTPRKLAAVMRDVSPKEVKATIEQLNADYENSDAAIRIVEDSGEYRMKLCDDLADVQKHFFGRDRATTLSQGAIDVLAIVGYNQPVSRSRIDHIRGRPSSGVLNQLIKRDLVAIEESVESKEKCFVTTDRFLELFSMDSLDDLPQTSVVSDLEELTDL